MKQKTKSKQSKIGKKYEIELSEKIGIRDSIKAKQKRPGYKRPIKEIFHGYKPSEDKEKYPLGVTEYMSIDRIENKYDQVVKDNLTGEICHEEHEPLSDHRDKKETRSKAKFKQTEIGKIPEEWEVKKISEIDTSKDTVLTGPFGSLLHARDYAEEGIPLLLVKNIGDGKIVDQDMPKVKMEKALELKKFWLKKGDIVFTRVGAVGRTLYISEDKENWMFSGQTLRIRIRNPKVNNRFIEYYFRTPIARYLSENTSLGTTRPSINTNILANRLVPLPPLNEQNGIVKILKSLDDKIELNQQMNKTLEAIAQAIFKHWFIDFEFPNEEGKPYKSSGGEMVYNEELGKEIPKGWKVGKLGEYIELDKGLSYKGKFLCEKEEGLPLINLGNIAPKFGFIYEALKYYKGEFKNRHLVKPGEIVIANTDITQRREVLGSPAIVPSDLRSEKILFTHHIYAVRNRSELPNTFLYYLLQLNGYRERVKGFATGTTVLALPRDAILDFKFTIPLKTILNLFTSTISLIQKRIDNNNLQKKSLSQIRDALLPKLMSGEIRVVVDKMEGQT